MNEQLEKRVKRQVYYATAILIINIVLWTVALILLVKLVEYIDDHKIGGKVDPNFKYKVSDIASGTILLASVWILGIAHLVIWILGIVNAVKINGITRNSVLLIIFSVLTFVFVYLIFALLEKRKLKIHGNTQLP